MKTCCGLLFLGALLEHASALPNTYPRQASNDSYDFIVVGGGTAGLAVASRISLGLPDSSILVIEAGPDGRNEPGIYIPGKKGSTLGGKYDWNFTTVAQPDANNRVLSQNRGKVLGGSSALNLMSWDRTSVAELDAWEKLGNTGWNWDSLYAAMLKVENFQTTTEDANEYGIEGVGHGGPIQTLINRILPAHQSTWIPTMNKLGLPWNKESLDGNPIGVMRQPNNIRESNYTRSYAPEYLTIAGSNLVLKMDTRVAKVNFSNKTASGVTLEDGTVITAKKEVILSAGSFQTPGLLELSGIGNSTLLTGLGIDVIQDLPNVGENLQDHIRIQNSYELKSNYTSFDVLRYNATRAAQELALYNADEVSLYDYAGSGYSYMNWSTVSADTQSTLLGLAESSTDNSTIEQTKKGYLTNGAIPQLEVIFSDGYTGVKGYPAAGSALYGVGTFSLISAIMHPLSRGSVHISSTSVDDKPTINPNYLSHPYDLAAAKTAAKFMRQIASTAPMSSVWTAEYEPGNSTQTDADWETYAKNNVLTIYHPAGTAQMMPQADGGVVDTSLKVYGVTGLRIVDASIMPILPSAHAQTLVYGIAEKAAALIIAEHSA